MTASTSHGASLPAVVSRSITDVDAYRSAVAGVEIEAVTTGWGTGPNTVRVVSDELITSTSVKIGFPILTRASVGDDRLIVASIQAAPPGSRWCDIDLHPGSVIAYGPGARHTATNPPGLEFSFVVTAVEELVRRGELLGSDPHIPDRGSVVELAGRPEVDAVAEHLATLAVMPEGRRPPSRLMDDALSAMVGALEPQAGTSPRPALSLIDDREIVHACVDYAVAIGRLPSLAELCIAARVSERRLRAAFVRLYDLAPSAFFRAWALTEAHRRLASAEETAGSVTEVALDLGFGHLGRFAHRYRQVHGDWPSATLRSRRLASAVSVG